MNENCSKISKTYVFESKMILKASLAANENDNKNNVTSFNIFIKLFLYTKFSIHTTTMKNTFKMGCVGWYVTNTV